MNNTKYTNQEIKEIVSENAMQGVGDKIITSAVRVAFPKIATPSDYNGNKRYESSFIIPDSENEVKFINLVKEFAIRNNIDFDSCQTSIQDQKELNEKGYQGFADSGIFFKATSKYEIPVVTPDRQRIQKESLNTRLYAGVWCLVSIALYKYTKEDGTQGIGFNLRNIMLKADDERFGNKEFDGLGGKDFKDIKVTSRFDSSIRKPGEHKVSTVYPVDGFNPRELAGAGWTREDMLGAGYTEEQMIAFNIV